MSNQYEQPVTDHPFDSEVRTNMLSEDRVSNVSPYEAKLGVI